MSVIRVNKTKDYTVMSNCHLRDTNLSLKAKGLLSMMLALPEDWDYSISGLVSICKEKETAVTSALDELKTYGYLKVTKLMPNETENGRFGYCYDVFEKPVEISEKQGVEKQGVENLGVENLGLEIQDLENPPLLNTNILNTNKEITNNNVSKTEKPPRKHFGTYGRVMLTVAEYDRLVNEFGQAQIDKQIQLVDEYVESNNNKNKYTNFNLVIRKSLRENWFNPNRKQTNKVTTNEPDWLKDYVNNFEDGVDDL